MHKVVRVDKVFRVTSELRVLLVTLVEQLSIIHSASNTSNTDLATGTLDLTIVHLSSATQMYIDDEDDGGTDIQAFLRTIDDSTSTIKKGHLKEYLISLTDDFAIFTISSATEQSGLLYSKLYLMFLVLLHSLMAKIYL